MIFFISTGKAGHFRLFIYIFIHACIIPELGSNVLDTHTPDPQIPISNLDILIWGSILNFLISGNDYRARYRMKIRLICRLTKDRHQALISIFTLIQKFSALDIDKYWRIFIYIFIFQYWLLIKITNYDIRSTEQYIYCRIRYRDGSKGSSCRYIIITVIVAYINTMKTFDLNFDLYQAFKPHRCT